jgi:hypothetical protein
VKIYGAEDRYPWVVKVSRYGEKFYVSLVEDVPERPEYRSNNGAIASARPPAPIARERTISQRPVSQGELDKAIKKAQAEADRLNASENAAVETLRRLALQEAGPE